MGAYARVEIEFRGGFEGQGERATELVQYHRFGQAGQMGWQAPAADDAVLSE
jgi:hypothetical protein